MKRLTPVSMHAVLLLSVLFLASCGGGDDGPTGPGSGGDGEGAAGGGAGRLDSRLFGTWILQESSEGAEGLSLTFKSDESVTRRVGEETDTRTWWTENGQLTVAVTSVFGYAIDDGELTFTADGEVSSELGEYQFTASGNPRGLMGVTWVDEDEDELVFSSDGTFDWADGFEEGAWAAQGRTIWIYTELETIAYEVRGETLTLSDDEYWAVYTKQ